MFETANPSVYARSNRFTVLEAVSFSLLLHAVAVAAALANSLWQVTFPNESPAMVVSFILAAPEPPPPPPAPAKPLARPEPQQAVVKPQEVVAPTVIPDEIPIVQPSVAPALVSAAPAGVEGGVAWGEEGGRPGGLLGGEIGGKVGGVIGGVGEGEAVADHMIRIARDKPLPMFPLSQVYPSYPEDARLSAWEDDLVVRYVIGKDGRIKAVEVVRPPEHAIFIDGTVRAIRSWRFRPLVRDGEKLEVVHELTIRYRLTQEG